MADASNCYDPSFWEGIWTENGGLQPGQRFDIGRSHPRLVALLPQLPHGRALVPGCGRGYDVATLAMVCQSVTGIDRGTAVVAAREYLRSAAINPHTHVEIVEADFFEYAAKAESLATVDLVYDYTFLCALPPSIRGRWAAAMTQLVRPGGVLLCLAFPLSAAGEEPDPERGPPFDLSRAIYSALLSPGFELERDEDVPIAESDSRRVGREAVLLWRRRAT